MKQVTLIRFESHDGKLFEDESKCQEYELLLTEYAIILDGFDIKPRPVDKKLMFANGKGYIQQPIGSRDSLWGWAKRNGWNRDSSSNLPEGKAGYRAHCMDDHDREWGQPYYALNPNTGEQHEFIE